MAWFCAALWPDFTPSLTLLPPRLLNPGDQVRLSTGPFADFVATVESIAPDRRVFVLMEIMGGETRVAVPVDQLRRA